MQPYCASVYLQNTIELPRANTEVLEIFGQELYVIKRSDILRSSVEPYITSGGKYLDPEKIMEA